MTKEFTQVQFVDAGLEKAEMLIALLSNIGYSGFEETGNGLVAFINSESFDQPALDEIAVALSVTYSISSIQDQNWNKQWESGFEPIIIGDFAAIRAGFHQPIKNVRHDIVITPKMSFGTGHHATTYMMIEQMSGIDMRKMKVADFGTGTGVLAILAEKMGASLVDAIDNDDWSIENAGENIETNQCHTIELTKSETLNTGSDYDLVLANINLNVILDNLTAISRSAKKGAEIVLRVS